jgi:hypothetical protein
MMIVAAAAERAGGPTAERSPTLGGCDGSSGINVVVDVSFSEFGI